MTAPRLALVLGGAMVVAAAGAATWGQTRQKADSIDQALEAAAAPAPKPKPRDHPASAPDTGPVAASALPGEASGDEDNPEVESAAPSAAPAAAKPLEPLKRPRYAVAVLQALDKVTAETMRFEAPVNQPVRYKTLIFTVHACETTAADEAGSDAIAHLEIDNQPKGPDGAPPPPARQVFRGWMYASSPGLNPFQHPTYDAWLIACKTASPPA
jgi:hypothetical protein